MSRPPLAPNPPGAQSALCLSVDSRLGPTNLSVPSHPDPPAAPPHKGDVRLGAATPDRPLERPRPGRGQTRGQKPPAPRPHLRGGVGAVHLRSRAGQPRASRPLRGGLPSPTRAPTKAAPGRAPLGPCRGPAGQRRRGPGVAVAPGRAPELRRPAADSARYLRPARQPAPLPRAAAAAAGAPLPSVSHWVSDATGPSAKRGSPIATAFICPPAKSNEAPPRLAGCERVPVQSQGPPGVEAPSDPHAECARGSRAAPARVAGLALKNAARSVEAPPPPPLLCSFAEPSAPFRKAVGKLAGTGVLGGGRSPPRAGRTGWREPAGGRDEALAALGGNHLLGVPGRGRGGRWSQV